MRLSLALAFALATTMMLVSPTSATENPADSEDPGIVGNATGGGWYADEEHPDPTTEELATIEAKAAIWDAYDDLVNGLMSQADFETTVAENDASAITVTNEVGLSALKPPECGKVDDPCPSKALKVAHVAQSTSYYCGPASGTMIARYLGKTKSAVAPHPKLSQSKLAGSVYMETDKYQVTPYWSNRFTKGLNKWLYGASSSNWKYAQVNKPSVKRFKKALRFNIDDLHPFGVSTVELKGEDDNYNSHEYGTHNAIGHWIVARGYKKQTKKVLFLDPATTIWQLTQKRFPYQSKKFVKSYVDRNGISAT